MANATSAFTFNQSADFGTSIAAFSEHMTGIDNVLGAALTASLSGLRDDTVSQGDL